MDDAGPALAGASARREQLREAMGGLEAALAAPLPGRFEEWWGGVRASLDRLAAVWDRHVVVVEAPGGLFDEVVDQAPRLAHAVDRLRREHETVGADIAALAGRDASGDALRAAGLDLLGRLAHHRHLGADLLHEAYAVDVAVGD